MANTPLPTTLLPTPSTSGVQPTDPLAVTEAFLASLADSDVDGAMDLLADDVVYTNVGLPTIRGRDAVARAMGGLSGSRTGFEVYIHSSAAEGTTVLNERTDVITVGRLRLQFWVMGRFEVSEGKITLWRDYFDLWDMARATVRGLASLALPGLSPRPPKPGDSPGR